VKKLNIGKAVRKITFVPIQARIHADWSLERLEASLDIEEGIEDCLPLFLTIPLLLTIAVLFLCSHIASN
jgi:NhaP-type Na+/H+ and K+/H+ antiporter